MSATKASPETERAGLREFLDYQREALIGKVQGLSDAEARLTPTASSLSLLSLLKHSAIWERRWFQVIMADQNLRFVALHMIEETARHAGHADIIRETIDGTRGR